MIGELATAIRNLDNDELDYEIGLGNKSKLTKKEIKLSKTVKVKSANGLVESQDFYLKMIEYFNELKEIRRILPK